MPYTHIDISSHWITGVIIEVGDWLRCGRVREGRKYFIGRVREGWALTRGLFVRLIDTARGAGAGSCLRCILLVKFNYIFGPSRRPLCTVMYPSRDNDEFFPTSTFLGTTFDRYHIFGRFSLITVIIFS